MGFSRTLKKSITYLGLVSLLNSGVGNSQTLFNGDGSNEPGFVPPPAQVSLPPPPPARMSSGESFVPYPPPPVVPQARSEKKNPPNPPVLMTKLRQGNILEWNAIPNDINNLLRLIKGKADVNYAAEIKSLEEISINPENNPIIFRGGHYHFSFSQEQRQKLREYLVKGGTIIFDTSLGSKPFFDSAKKELGLIFPEIPLQKLSLDHPVFHSYYDLDGNQKINPWIEGVTINCRTLAFLSRWGLGVGWAQDEKNIYQAYDPEFATKLGMNIISYSASQRAWQKNLANALSLRDIDTTKSGKLSLAQIIYDGEWKTRHKGISILLYEFNKKTQVPVSFSCPEIKLSDRALFNHPLIYMTGHEDFKLNQLEETSLREYLKSGGTLFAESCCGRPAFDVSFRRMLKRIFPENNLQKVSEQEPIFMIPNKISEVGVTPALESQLKTSRTKPHLEQLFIGDRVAVIYSPFSLAGGWELAQNPYALGYDESGSLAIGENILFNALIQ